MMFNPWAAVVFLFGGLFLFGAGLLDEAWVTVAFFLFAPAWIACGYLWDMLTIRNPK